MKHIYHYSVHAEKRFFLGDLRALYDIVGINGNIVSHTPSGVAGFVATATKPFFIDPQTHAFQHATMNLKSNIAKRGEKPVYEFKPSIEKLASQRLGPPFSNVIRDDKPLTPAAFFGSNGKIDAGAIEGVSQSVVDFQLNTLRNEVKDDVREFLDFESDFRPEFVIAPYFYLDPANLVQWLSINVELHSATKSFVEDLPVFMPILISKYSLIFDHELVLSAIESAKPDGILIWVDNFVEEDLQSKELIQFGSFLSKLHKYTGTIYNLHGGYFSTLLGHIETGSSLDGSGHSMNYGEFRPIIPVGGGIPMARFYLPRVHTRMKYGDAVALMRQMGWMDSIDSYRENVCKCEECTKLIGSTGSLDAALEVYGESTVVESRRRSSGTTVRLQYPTSEAKLSATLHYLYNKHREFESCKAHSLSTILEQLSGDFKLISETSNSPMVAPLAAWSNAIAKLAMH